MRLSEQMALPIDGPLIKPIMTISQSWYEARREEIIYLEKALEELQRGIYSFPDASLEVKNFVYRITRQALRGE